MSEDRREQGGRPLMVANSFRVEDPVVGSALLRQDEIVAVVSDDDVVIRERPFHVALIAEAKSPDVSQRIRAIPGAAKACDHHERYVLVDEHRTRHLVAEPFRV